MPEGRNRESCQGAGRALPAYHVGTRWISAYCGEVLTASRAEPAIYQVGAYRDFLRRISPIAHHLGGPADEVAQALRQAQAGPSYFP